MRLKRLVRYLAASMLFAASGAAFAVPTTVTNLGTLDANGTQFEKSWARWFGAGSSSGTFSDVYNFNLSAAADAVGSMFKFNFGTLFLSLDSVSLYKVDAAGEHASVAVDTSPTSFIFESLGSGSYALDVAGTLTVTPSFIDVGGAYYQGTIKSFASHAPEPAALVMGLAGLLAVGSVVGSRRRG